MAAEEGVGCWIAPYDNSSFLRPVMEDPSRDIPLVNLGVLLLPGVDVPSSAFAAHIVHGRHDSTGKPRSTEERVWLGKLMHNTFNHISSKALKHLPDVSNVPASWKEAIFDAEPCDDCLAGTCKRVHSSAHAPNFKEPGHLSVDGWENRTGHVHGGQRLVWGMHDAHSRLNKSYLCAKKSEHAVALDTCLTWCRAHGVNVKSCNADNAPDLIKGASAEVMAKHKVHSTSCPPYDPKGNSLRERGWQTQADAVRRALVMSKLPDAYWWYAWRDSEQKSWCVPQQYADGWSCAWTKWSGRPANAAVQVPFGCLAYVKEYHPVSKTALQGKRCIVLWRCDTQPAWLCLEVATGRLCVSPHVHFVPDTFPGLKQSGGGGGRDRALVCHCSQPHLGTASAHSAAATVAADAARQADTAAQRITTNAFTATGAPYQRQRGE